jgi:tetratricopeptide (TPR) repeat protein
VVALWQADAARRAARDQGLMKDFLFEVLRMSSPFDQGDELTLSAALDQAAQAIDARFAGRRDLAAEIRYGIGYSMVDRYRLEQAEVQLQRALEDGIAEFGRDDLRVLRMREGIAGLRMEQSRFEEAEAGYREVIAGLEQGGYTAEALYGQAVGNLGNLYLTQERYAEAMTVLRQAQAVDQAHGSDAYDSATLLSNLAHAAHGLEDLPLAEELYTQAGDAMRALFPDGSPDLAIIYNNHAMLREERGAIPAALQMHAQSLAMRRKVFRDSHPMVVSSLANIARLQINAGDAAAALQTATEGAAMADAVYTEPNRFHPSVHATLAAAHLANDDAPAARRAWLRARELLQALPDAPPSTTRWIEEVRTRYCAKVELRDVLCREAPPAPGG